MLLDRVLPNLGSEDSAGKGDEKPAAKGGALVRPLYTNHSPECSLLHSVAFSCILLLIQ